MEIGEEVRGSTLSPWWSCEIRRVRQFSLSDWNGLGARFKEFISPEEVPVGAIEFRERAVDSPKGAKFVDCG
jgi:hypothetical protein